MLSLSISSVVLLALSGSTLAKEWQKSKGALKPNNLVSRQTHYGHGATCADAFGAGYEQCGTGIYCYNPEEGQICCSEGYHCDSDEYCLVDDTCCPKGISPESCASDNLVSLPSGLQTSGIASAVETYSTGDSLSYYGTGSYTSYDFSASSTTGSTSRYTSTAFSTSEGTTASTKPTTTRTRTATTASTTTTPTRTATAAGNKPSSTTSSPAAVNSPGAAAPQHALGGAAVLAAGVLGLAGNFL